jgi:predicted HAD superfamily phosphohydrolase
MSTVMSEVTGRVPLIHNIQNFSSHLIENTKTKKIMHSMETVGGTHATD